MIQRFPASTGWKESKSGVRSLGGKAEKVMTQDFRVNALTLSNVHIPSGTGIIP